MLQYRAIHRSIPSRNRAYTSSHRSDMARNRASTSRSKLSSKASTIHGSNPARNSPTTSKSKLRNQAGGTSRYLYKYAFLIFLQNINSFLPANRAFTSRYKQAGTAPRATKPRYKQADRASRSSIFCRTASR